MKQLKWFFRVVVVGFWGYCVYAALPFSIGDPEIMEKGFAGVIGIYSILGLMLFLAGIVLFFYNVRYKMDF